MSYDHISVSNNSWDEMSDRIKNNESYIQCKKERIAQINESIERKMQELKELREANDRKVKESVNSFLELSRGLLVNTDNTLNAGLHLQERSLESAITGLRDAVSDSVKRLEDVGVQITEVSEKYNSAFETMLENETDKSKRVNRIVEEMESMLAVIDKLDPVRFSPDKYNGVVSSIEELRRDIASKDFDSAMIVSQEAILDTTRLLAELQVANEIYARRFNEVMKRAIGISHNCATLLSRDNLLKVEVEGSEMEFEYDAVFWSDGKIAAAVDAFNERYALLLEGKLDNEQLERLDGDLTIIENYLNLHDRRARQNMTNSVIAADAAKRLHECMRNSNLYLESSGYVEGDAKKPYAMSYSGPNSSKISVIVTPEASPSIMLEVFSNDENFSDIMKDDINSRLSNFGMKSGGRFTDTRCDLYPDHESFVDYVMSREENMRRY